MKKRIAYILLIAALLLSLTACGKQPSDEADRNRYESPEEIESPGSETDQFTDDGETPEDHSAEEPPDDDADKPTETPDAFHTVTPEFKEAMDSYEAFFDEYITFMEEFEDSDSSLELLADYAEYMTRYAEVMQKLDEIDTDSLSEADQLYCLEVQSRISEKLLTVN